MNTLWIMILQAAAAVSEEEGRGRLPMALKWGGLFGKRSMVGGKEGENRSVKIFSKTSKNLFPVEIFFFSLKEGSVREGMFKIERGGT